MKKLVNLFLSLCCCVAVFSQNLRDFSVISFKEDIYSSTATNRRYKLVDGNGETFSIIKLNAVTPDDDLSAYSLDFGCYEGRKKIVDGEVWWYVQCNAKHATISREGYKTLKYELDKTVEPGTVYYMTFEVIDSGAVDLGLSVKWASCNLGASKPEEYGGYYAWCETEEKEEYYGSNYFFYDKEIVIDIYNRKIPKPAKGTVKINGATNSISKVRECLLYIFDYIVDKDLLVKRINISANNVSFEKVKQLELFTDVQEIKKEESIQQVVLNIHKKYGKNSVLKGFNYQECSTTRERNRQIGGHKA